MLASARLRRVFVAVSATGLAATAAFVPAGSAYAVPLPPAQLQVQASSNGASGCAITAGSNPSTSPIPFVNGKASGAVSIDVTWTNGSNSADTTHVTGSYSESSSITTAHGSLHTFNVSGQGTVSAAAALGASSTCNVQGYVAGQVQAPFHLATSGWVYVSRNQPKSTVSETAIESSAGTPYVDIFAGPKNTSSTRVFLPAGDYIMVNVFELTTAQFFLKSAPQVSLKASFVPAGGALAATSGPGRAYVTFPSAVSCTHHTATLTWRSKASKVATGTFLVNGRTKATVTHAVSGRHVVLRHLSATKDAKVVAKLKLKDGSTVTATRTYAACTG